jgi:hypothetical protein
VAARGPAGMVGHKRNWMPLYTGHTALGGRSRI